MSSRLRTVPRLREVRVFTLTYEKTNHVFGAPPEPGMPAADVPPRSRLRGVLIVEQNGAPDSMPCAFRFQAALEPTSMSCNDIVNTPFKRFSVLEWVTWPVY